MLSSWDESESPCAVRVLFVRIWNFQATRVLRSEEELMLFEGWGTPQLNISANCP